MTKKLTITKCPHCEEINKTNRFYVDCEVCGNGYPAKDYKVDDKNE